MSPTIPRETNTDCLREERQRLILERLESDGRVVALQLARDFGTSEDTIRRDLRELAAAGRCQRVYGGALPRLSPSPLDQRIQTMAPDKQVLGQRLARLLPQDQVVFVDAGATNLAAIRALAPGFVATLITHAPAIAAEAITHEGIQVVTIGGALDRSVGAALGGGPLREISDLRPDVFLLGCCALDVQAGIGCFGFGDAEIKRALIERSRRVMTAVTNDKLITSAPFIVAPVDCLADVVLEADAPVDIADGLRQRGITVHGIDEENAR